MVSAPMVMLLVGAVGLVAGMVAYSLGARIGGLNRATETAAMIIEINNEILRFWAAFAVMERIEGFPIRIEMVWNPQLDWLLSAVVVIRQGFKNVQYDVVLKERLRKSGAKVTITGALTFEQLVE